MPKRPESICGIFGTKTAELWYFFAKMAGFGPRSSLVPSEPLLSLVGNLRVGWLAQKFLGVGVGLLIFGPEGLKIGAEGTVLEKFWQIFEKKA